MGQFLEKPNTDKQVTSGSGPNGIRYGFAAMQGWRIEMEDAHSLFPNVGGDRYPGWSFFAIFDGHAGDKVSKYASEHLWRCIESHLPILPPAATQNSTINLSVGSGGSRTKSPSRETAGSPKLVTESSTLSVRTISDALKMGFFDMDQQLRELPDIQDGLDKSGSTAVSALITPQYTFLVNVGDSRAILIRDNQVQMATMDHKPSNEKERKRIVDAGGLVIIQRVNGSLAVSRALGDFEYKADPNRLPQNQLVSPEADVFVSERDLKGDQHLVLACDGIWDVMSNDDVCQFVSIKIKQGRDAAGICADLLDTCLAKGSKDNMSVIIVSFPQQQSSGSGHSQFSPQSRTDLPKSRGGAGNQ